MGLLGEALLYFQLIDRELYGEEVILIFMYSFDILSRGCSALNIEEEDMTAPAY